MAELEIDINMRIREWDVIQVIELNVLSIHHDLFTEVYN